MLQAMSWQMQKIAVNLFLRHLEIYLYVGETFFRVRREFFFRGKNSRKARKEDDLISPVLTLRKYRANKKDKR